MEVASNSLADTSSTIEKGSPAAKVPKATVSDDGEINVLSWLRVMNDRAIRINDKRTSEKEALDLLLDVMDTKLSKKTRPWTMNMTRGMRSPENLSWLAKIDPSNQSC